MLDFSTPESCFSTDFTYFRGRVVYLLNRFLDNAFFQTV